MKFKNLKFYLLTILSIFLFSLKTYAVDVNIGGILLPNAIFNNDRTNNILFVLNQARTFINNDHNDKNNNQRNQLPLIERMIDSPNNVQITYQGHPTIITNENNEPTVTQSVIFSLGAIPLTAQGQICFNGNQISINFVSTNIKNLHHIDITNADNINNLDKVFIAVNNNQKCFLLSRLNMPGNQDFAAFLNMTENCRYNIDRAQKINNHHQNQEHLYVMITSGTACHLFDFFYNI